MTDGLKDAHREAIIAAIAANDRVERAVLFGSRATGTNTVTSDVDIALFGDRLTMTDQAHLAAAVDEIPLAQSVDLILYDSVRDPTLREHVRNDGVEWFTREHAVMGATGGAEIRRAALADIIDLTLSSVDKKSKPRERPVRLCNYMDVYNNTFITDQLDFMAATATDREVARCGLVHGDVIITKDSEKHDDIGVPALVRHDIANLVCGYHLAILRPRPAQVTGSYLVYALKAPPAQHQFHAYANGVTRFGLRKGDIGLVEVPLPPLATQRAIAHVLGTLDDKIELNRRMNETLEAMAKALFKSWFVDFDPVRAKMEGRDTGLPRDLADLFPDRMVDSEMGEIPEGWRRRTLADLARLNPESWSRRNAPNRIQYVDLANTKWGSINDIQEFTWEEAPSRGRRVLRRGDTIVGTVRPRNGSFALIDRDGLTGSTAFAVLRPATPTDRELVWCAATSQDAIERLAHLADGGAYPAVRPKAVLDTVVALPDARIRLAFSSLAASVVNRMGATQRESRTLADLRDILLPRLISGEIRVPATDQGPAR